MKKFSSFKNFETKELSVRKMESSKGGAFFLVPPIVVGAAMLGLGGVASWRIFG